MNNKITRLLLLKAPMTSRKGDNRNINIFIYLLILAQGCHAVVIPSEASKLIRTQRVTLATQPNNKSCPIECVCEETSVSCKTTKGSWLPLDLPSNLTSLSLDGYNLTSLTALRHLLRLEALTIASSNIRQVNVIDFEALARLEFINLSDNQLTGTLDSRVFAILVNLKHLNLSNNLLESVGNEAFYGLENLISLDLGDNVIRQIEQNAFKSLVKLEELNLSGNLLTNLSSSWFASLTNLKTLQISRNDLTTIYDNQLKHLPNLEKLDLSYNKIATIEPRTFDQLSNLLHLNLNNNQIRQLDDAILHSLKNLQILDLSASFIPELKPTLLSSNTKLQSIVLDNLANLTTIENGAFQRLDQLINLTISNNPQLQFIHPNALKNLKNLQRLNLANNNLTSLHKQTLTPVSPTLTELNLSGNPWTCDCHMSWLPKWLNESNIDLRNKNQTKCENRKFVQEISDDNCSKSVILNHTVEVVTRLGATALLECRVSGNPQPSLTWILPRNHHIFHFYPTNLPVQWYFPYQYKHPHQHDTKNISTSSAIFTERIRVLKNGNLFISRVLNVDAGTYTCLAFNTLSNDTARVTLTLNYQILIHVKVISILVGLATSIAALLLLLVFQLVNMAINRWGCCCCGGMMSPKAKQILKMLETVEQYKSQQLERLRENYTMQANRIKDNCAQQMDRIRDSYGTQVDRLRDICDFGTQQLDKVREQYYEQVKKVRDYSSGQMGKVRENYIFQRTRIRKFSAHQMIRFRENYKLQQLHLNKILETLNIESCRTGCSRSTSIDFSTDAVFSTNLVALPAPLFPGDRHSMIGSDNQSDYFTPSDSITPEQFSCPTTPTQPQQSQHQEVLNVPRDSVVVCAVQIELVGGKDQDQTSQQLSMEDGSSDQSESGSVSRETEV